MRNAFILFLLAAACWFLLFFPGVSGRFNFWVLLSAASALLAGAGTILNLHEGLRANERTNIYGFAPRHIPIGLASAYILYVVFLGGRMFLARYAPASESQIAAVYAHRLDLPPAAIAALLALLIGPAEELFWRGYLQTQLGRRFGPAKGYAGSALLYAGVHIFSLNPALVCAALICGLFWGGIFKKYRSVWPGVISHAAWDVAVFVLLPLSPCPHS